MYVVKNVKTRKTVSTSFKNREEAKVVRDKMEEDTPKGLFTVSRGPDHPKGESFPNLPGRKKRRGDDNNKYFTYKPSNKVGF